MCFVLVICNYLGYPHLLITPHYIIIIESWLIETIGAVLEQDILFFSCNNTQLSLPYEETIVNSQPVLFSRHLLNIEHTPQFRGRLNGLVCTGIMIFIPFSSMSPKILGFTNRLDTIPHQEHIIQAIQWRRCIYLCTSCNFSLCQGMGKSISTYATVVLIAALMHGSYLFFNSCSTAQKTELKVLHPFRHRCSQPSPSRLKGCGLGRPWENLA